MNDDNEHPLFPLEDDADAYKRPIGWISIMRQEGSVQKTAPAMFAAAELVSEEQIAELYGGGQYELVARDPSRARIVTRRRLTIDGRPRPLIDPNAEDDDGGESDAKAARAAMAVAQAATAPGLTLSTVLPALSTLAPVVIGWMQSRDEREQRRYEAERAREDARQREFLTLMTTQASASTQGASRMSEQLLSLALSKPGGQDGVGAFMRGVEFAREHGAAEEEAGDTFMSDLNEALETFAAMRHAPDVAPSAAGLPTSPPRAPGNGDDEDDEDDEGDSE